MENNYYPFYLHFHWIPNLTSCQLLWINKNFEAIDNDKRWHSYISTKTENNLSFENDICLLLHFNGQRFIIKSMVYLCRTDIFNPPTCTTNFTGMSKWKYFQETLYFTHYILKCGNAKSSFKHILRLQVRSTLGDDDTIDFCRHEWIA